MGYIRGILGVYFEPFGPFAKFDAWSSMLGSCGGLKHVLFYAGLKLNTYVRTRCNNATFTNKPFRHIEDETTQTQNTHTVRMGKAQLSKLALFLSQANTNHNHNTWNILSGKTKQEMYGFFLKQNRHGHASHVAT